MTLPRMMKTETSSHAHTCQVATVHKAFGPCIHNKTTWSTTAHLRYQLGLAWVSPHLHHQVHAVHWAKEPKEINSSKTALMTASTAEIPADAPDAPCPCAGLLSRKSTWRPMLRECTGRIQPLPSAPVRRDLRSCEDGPAVPGMGKLALKVPIWAVRRSLLQCARTSWRPGCGTLQRPCSVLRRNAEMLSMRIWSARTYSSSWCALGAPIFILQRQHVIHKASLNITTVTPVFASRECEHHTILDGSTSPSRSAVEPTPRILDVQDAASSR